MPSSGSNGRRVAERVIHNGPQLRVAAAAAEQLVLLDALAYLEGGNEDHARP